MVFNRTDATTVRHANHDRHIDETFRAVRQLRKLANDLVEGRVDETVELNFGNWAIAAHRQTDCSADDA